MGQGGEEERMGNLQFPDILMNNGSILEGKKIGELVKEIINKLSDANLTCDEGKIALDKAKDLIGEYSSINKID